MKTANRRVGTLTAGLSLIAAGVLFLIHIFWPGLLAPEIVFGLWPLILIGVGIELLIFRFKPSEQAPKFDWVSVILVVVLVLAAFSLEGARQWAMYWMMY